MLKYMRINFITAFCLKEATFVRPTKEWKAIMCKWLDIKCWPLTCCYNCLFWWDCMIQAPRIYVNQHNRYKLQNVLTIIVCVAVGVPLDGTPDIEVVGVNPGLSGFFIVLSVVGIILAIVGITIHLILRKKS